MKPIRKDALQKVTTFSPFYGSQLIKSFSDVFQFTCPKVNESYAATHPRYADPDDCQFFYVCINGEIPRRNGCKLGQAFDEEKKSCEWARQVPDW